MGPHSIERLMLLCSKKRPLQQNRECQCRNDNPNLVISAEFCCCSINQETGVLCLPQCLLNAYKWLSTSPGVSEWQTKQTLVMPHHVASMGIFLSHVPCDCQNCGVKNILCSLDGWTAACVSISRDSERAHLRLYSKIIYTCYSQRSTESLLKKAA